jgi:hypothetical protein
MQLRLDGGTDCGRIAWRRQIMSDVHSPSEFRVVNVPLRNMPEFYACHQCQRKATRWYRSGNDAGESLGRKVLSTAKAPKGAKD